jgi:hypothetical protein
MNRNEVIDNLKIVGEEEVSIYEDSITGDINNISSLTVEGGIACKKGFRVGFQENLVGGLMIYDGENFYGFSDKFGMCLLSNHQNNIFLQLPEKIFLEKKTLTATNSTNQIQNSKKKLNMDIEVKDIGYFYTIIPELYEKNNIELLFNLDIIYDEQTSLNEIYIVFINESNKTFEFEFDEKIKDKFYYSKDYRMKINKKEICEIKIKKINKNYILSSQNFYYK